ncbi:MAG: hypothetical protein J7K46_09065 [Bacteroidales bacterium]|nr:hypothetical protein [Bacteroidales bacterium]
MISKQYENIIASGKRQCEALKKWFFRHIYGVLGTIIVHLLLAIFFMIFKLSSLKEPEKQPILITFEQEPTPEEQGNTEKEKPLVPDEQLKKWIHDIPVNEAMKKKEDFDINKYIDQVKEEMIRQGQLTQDNYIDEQKMEEAAIEQALRNKLRVKEETLPGDSLAQSEIMASHYSGPTRVKYNLAGRIARNLVIPIYKCEGSGVVIVHVVVNQNGKVIEASIDTNKSDHNPCLYEAALRAARFSRFDIDLDAPDKQKGTITYYFVAQGG